MIVSAPATLNALSSLERNYGDLAVRSERNGDECKSSHELVDVTSTSWWVCPDRFPRGAPVHRADQTLTLTLTLT